MSKKFFDAEDRMYGDEEVVSRREREFKTERRNNATNKRSFFESLMRNELDSFAAAAN